MKKLLFLVAIFTFASSFSQVSVSGNKIIKDGQTYKFSQYKEAFQNPEAQNYFAKARTNNTVAQVFAYGGGFCLGWGLGSALSGKKTTGPTGQTIKKDNSGAWTMVGIGAGIIGIGIPFALAAKKNADKAVSAENGGSTAFKSYFKLETAGNGLAFSYNF